MTDADIHAFTPAGGAPGAGPRPPRPPHRIWPWVLGAAVAITLLAAGSLAALLLTVFDGLRDSAHVVINGEPWNWHGGSDWSGIWSDGDWGGGFGGGVAGFIIGSFCLLLVGLLVAVIVVPCVVLAVGLAGLGVAFAVAAVLGSVGLVVALVFSPLWLFALLLWLVLRRRPQRVAA